MVKGGKKKKKKIVKVKRKNRINTEEMHGPYSQPVDLSGTLGEPHSLTTAPQTDEILCSLKKKLTLSPDRSLPKGDSGSEGTAESGTVKEWILVCVLWPESEDETPRKAAQQMITTHHTRALLSVMQYHVQTWPLNLWSTNCKVQRVMKGSSVPLHL